MKKYHVILMLASIMLLASCDSKKNEYDPYKISGGKAKEEVSKSAFEIDYKEYGFNLKTIHVTLNGAVGYDAVFDTGCSGVSLSSLELLALMKQRTILETDKMPPVYTETADGTQQAKEVYNLREVTVMDKNGKPHTLRDIHATIEPNIQATLLIGGSVIDNLAKKSYTVDLKKKVIRFE